MITLKETTERYNLGQNKTIQNADQSYDPTGITCTNVLLVTDLCL